MNKEVYKDLTKEQLIYLVEQFEHSMFFIGETCIDESKNEIDPHVAVIRIRKNIFFPPFASGSKNLAKWIDYKRGMISAEDYRKSILNIGVK